MVLTMLDGPCSLSLNIDSTTLISVDVVSSPQNAVQSLATTPAPNTSDPRFTVPATNGICEEQRLDTHRSGATPVYNNKTNRSVSHEKMPIYCDERRLYGQVLNMKIDRPWS